MSTHHDKCNKDKLYYLLIINLIVSSVAVISILGHSAIIRSYNADTRGFIIQNQQKILAALHLSTDNNVLLTNITNQVSKDAKMAVRDNEQLLKNTGAAADFAKHILEGQHLLLLQNQNLFKNVVIPRLAEIEHNQSVALANISNTLQHIITTNKVCTPGNCWQPLKAGGTK